MRHVTICFVAACAAALLVASGAPAAKSSQGVMCVLHAKLSAKNETTGSTSTAKGHTLIKVRNDGTIEFKTQILNKANEMFVAGHIHQAPVGVAGPIVVPLFVSPTPPTSARHIRQSGVATPNAGTTGADLCAKPERLLRQLPHDSVPGRRDPRPAPLATAQGQRNSEGRATARPSASRHEAAAVQIEPPTHAHRQPNPLPAQANAPTGQRDSACRRVWWHPLLGW